MKPRKSRTGRSRNGIVGKIGVGPAKEPGVRGGHRQSLEVFDGATTRVVRAVVPSVGADFGRDCKVVAVEPAVPSEHRLCRVTVAREARWFTVPMTARALGVTDSQVRWMIKHATLPATFVPGGTGGGEWRIDPDVVAQSKADRAISRRAYGEKIKAALANSNPLSANQVALIAGTTQGYTHTVLQALASAGEVVRTGQGVSARYELPPQSDAPNRVVDRLSTDPDHSSD